MELPGRFPPRGSSLVIAAGAGGDPLPALLSRFEALGCRLSRDVEIGAHNDGKDLVAQDGDFWFHSDGCFLVLSPRWVVIQVLVAEGGGGLSVLGCARMKLPAGAVWYGRDKIAGIAANVVSRAAGRTIVRYRKDYMHSLPDGADLETVHRMIDNHARTSARQVGELGPLDCLVVDNWTVLHRRLPFQGKRVIRRLWFEDAHAARQD